MFVDSAFARADRGEVADIGFRQCARGKFRGSQSRLPRCELAGVCVASDEGLAGEGAIPDEEQLALQICLPGYHINRSNKLVLESKSDLARRGEASPDDADALAPTFAQHVAPIEAQQQEPVLYDIFVDGFSGLGGGWMG